ncbi:MAG: c-type cytochrome [Chitinophagales bacterium]
MKVTYVLLAILLLIVLINFSCQHELQWPKNTVPVTDSTSTTTPSSPTPPPSLPPPIAGSSCSPDSVYFANTILPLISSNCAMSGCHNGLSGGDAGQYTLNTYAGIKAIVKAGNPTGSKLVSVIADGSMPPRGHTALTQAQLTSIETWIGQGALNNTCSASSCDTSNVTYSASVTVILQNYCTGCHSGSAPSGAVNLTTYAGVLAQVQNGKFWGDISHTTGYNAMPVGGTSLSDCDLNIINSWIKKGAQNN